MEEGVQILELTPVSTIVKVVKRAMAGEYIAVSYRPRSSQDSAD